MKRIIQKKKQERREGGEAEAETAAEFHVRTKRDRRRDCKKGMRNAACNADVV